MPKRPRATRPDGKKRSRHKRQTASFARSLDPAEPAADGSDSPAESKPPEPPAPGLYIVATPIGNARDVTLRALDILGRADAIACEDTRVTRRLLTMHGIRANALIAYHEHNAEALRPKLMERLKSGEIVALVSDAGTPMINDPGYPLAAACRDAGIAVHAVPGASAVTTALVLAGLPTDRFMYAGFPPAKAGRRRTWLGELADVPATLVFLEAPRRLAASLADMAEILGPRPAAVAREMTKMFEEVRRGPLDALARHYADHGPPKGEITIVVGPPDKRAAPDIGDVDARLRDALETESVREAAARIAAETGISRRDVYARALTLKDDGK